MFWGWLHWQFEKYYLFEKSATEPVQFAGTQLRWTDCITPMESSGCFE